MARRAWVAAGPIVRMRMAIKGVMTLHQVRIANGSAPAQSRPRPARCDLRVASGAAQIASPPRMPRVSKTRVEGSEIAAAEIRTAVEREEAKDCPLVVFGGERGIRTRAPQGATE